jgi:NitT/TauT family transport system substrate-binding protein
VAVTRGKVAVLRWSAALLGALLLVPAAHAGDPIKIGLLRVPASGPLYIAVERGYFAAEGLDPQLVYFESGPPVPTGIVSGDLDFGAGALIGAFYNLAGQGALRIIGALAREMPGFQGQGYIVTQRLYEAGFTSLKQFAGHSLAVTAVGGPAHYATGLLADKYGFALSSVRIVVTQSLSNAIAAVETGQTDTTVISMTAAIPPILQRGGVKLLGWVGDETPWQYGAVFTASRTADNRPALVERFLRAYHKATKDYHDAFTGADGRRNDGPTAPAILGILAKYTGQSAENVKFSVTYADADARLDIKDVQHQIEWYRAQGLIKGEVDGSKIIDQRYVRALSP